MVFLDYRLLVSYWFNEYLPDNFGDCFQYVNGGVAYLDSFCLSNDVLSNTVKYMISKYSEIANHGDKNITIIQEPKPINNVKIRPMLLEMEKNDKILHIANRRYVLNSKDVYIHNDKDMEEFLGVKAFDILSKILNTYRIESFPISDFIKTANRIFPKKIPAKFISDDIQKNNHIKILSSNDILEKVVDCKMGFSYGKNISKFIRNSEKTLENDILSLISISH